LRDDNWPKCGPLLGRNTTLCGKVAKLPRSGSWPCSERPSIGRITLCACWRPLDSQDEKTFRRELESATASTLTAARRLTLRFRVFAGGDRFGRFRLHGGGEQVGLAQRMESVAPPGEGDGSASPRRGWLWSGDWGEYELVKIKGARAGACPVALAWRRHRADGGPNDLVGRAVGRCSAVGLDGARNRCHGAVVGVFGPPGHW